MIVPSKSGKQHRMMAMVANDPTAAKRLGIPQSVGQEFMKADKGRKFSEGGEMESKKMMKKEVAFMKAKGAPKAMIKHEEKEAKGMKSGGKCYAKGGFTKAADGIASKGKTKAKQIKMAGGGKC